MTTLTAPAATGLPATLRRLFGPWLATPTVRQTRPEGVAELLARADRYESTQPGFAADLRAAARRVLEAR